MNDDALYDFFSRNLSIDRIMEHAEKINATDRKNTFSGYAETADYVEKSFTGAGADEVRRIPIPCDGKHRFGDWVMPLAWDATEGVLNLLDENGGVSENLCNFKNVPESLVKWSRPTRSGGETFRVVYVADPFDPPSWQGIDAKDKLVFTHAAGNDLYRKLIEHGAAGFISDFSNAPGRFPDHVEWCNNYSPYRLWGLPSGFDPILGFSIAPSQGRRLLEKLKTCSDEAPLLVRANVSAKLYEGTTDVVTAEITGQHHSKREIIFYAHYCEGPINDNAASVAAYIEMIRVIKSMIENGAISRPAISLKFVTGWEWIGSDYYALEVANKRPVAAICHDDICLKQQLANRPFSVHLSPDFAVTCADAYFLYLWEKFVPVHYPLLAWQIKKWEGSTDTYWVDPSLGGCSNVMPIQKPGEMHHKSHSSLDQVDRHMLQTTALLSLLWGYQLAIMTQRDMGRFARIAAGYVSEKIRNCAIDFEFERHDTGDNRARFKSVCNGLRKMVKRTFDFSAFALGANAEVRALEKNAIELVESQSMFADNRFIEIEKSQPKWISKRPFDLKIEASERVAANIVPERLVRAPLRSYSACTPETIEQLRSLGWIDQQLLFLFNGQRTLLEAINTFEADTGRKLNIKTEIKKFRLLAASGYLSLAYKTTATRETILHNLADLGITDGDTLIVHSSLQSLGPIEGGPETLFAALEEMVGPNGTTAFPSFAFNMLERTPGAPFDVKKTPSRVGTLTNLFWPRKNVSRSRNPSHGFAASGKYAQYLTADTLLTSPFGIEGVFGRFYRLDAKILMVGCGFGPNTSLHALEDWANLPCMYPVKYHYLDEEGERREIVYEKMPNHHRNFYTGKISNYERIMRENNFVTDGKIALARAFVMSIRDLIDTGLSCFREKNFDFLFEKNPVEPGEHEIRQKLETEWKFPEEVLHKLEALKKMSGLKIAGVR